MKDLQGNTNSRKKIISWVLPNRSIFSWDEKNKNNHNFKSQTKGSSFVQVLGYVSCLYDNKWCVGIITNVDKEEEDVQVKFMHPSSPSRSFQ